jgi:hypothetical protein
VLDVGCWNGRFRLESEGDDEGLLLPTQSQTPMFASRGCGDVEDDIEWVRRRCQLARRMLVLSLRS